MNQLVWIVQNNLWNERGYEAFIEAIKRFDMKYYPVKVIPFSNRLKPEIKMKMGEDYIAYGMYSMNKIAQARQWWPGVFYSSNFNYNVLVQNWGDAMLNADATYHKLSEVQFDGIKFIRPIGDSKAFNAEIVGSDEFTEWRQRILSIGTHIKSDDRVIMATPKKIFREYRFFVVNRQIVTGGRYKLGSVLAPTREVDPFITEWTQKQVDKWAPHDHFVVDTAMIENGELKIIEVNTLNAAGLYDCDPNKIVGAIYEWHKSYRTYTT